MSDASGSFHVRRGTADDAKILLDLFDESVRWLVSRGFTAQWGTQPFSEIPRRVEAARGWAAGGGLWIAERAGRPAAAMVLGAAHDYVPPASEPELYVRVLVGSHEPFARGAGAHLLDHAEAEGREQGVSLLRVDCFAGNGGALVRFYERCGFGRTEQFLVGDWRGQLLVRRLDRAAATPRAVAPPAR